MREIYEAVGREAMVTGASDDDRMAEVRKRMLAADLACDSPCGDAGRCPPAEE